MQSFNDANLRCCECQGKFSSASALLHHFAGHALEKQGNKHGEGNFSRYDWQPWRYDDIFKTKRKGHNFLETALLSINETCRKRAKLHAATPVSTSSENSSHSLTGKSEMSEAEAKGGEHSQDDENQCLSNSCRSYSKCSSKLTKENPNTSNSSECKNTLSTFSTDNSKNTSNIIKENRNFSHKIECSRSNKIPSKFKLEKSNRISIVEESEKLLNNIDIKYKILPKNANDSLKGINNVEENLNSESSANKCSKKSSKIIAKHSKSFSIVEECQGLKNVSEKGSKCSVEVSTTNKFGENNVKNSKLSDSLECSIEECRKTSLINSGNESKVTKNEKYKDELLENTTDGCELVKIVKIEKPLSKNNDCIVDYSGPEPNMSPKSVNLELPLELRTSKTCFNRSNDVCDVVYDNDDNNLNLGDSLGKVNCDNNNVIIHYNDNSQCELPKIINKRGRGVVEKEEKCEVVEECGIEEGKRKLSNRKQTTPKKIERIENEFLKIAPRPDNLPRDDRVSPNKKGTKKKYCCPLCSRVFGWSTDLKRHILVHTGERPFKCASCTSSFTRKFLLQKHQNKMHPLNGKTERERLLELKVSENLKELKSKMLELQKSKESNYKNGSRESNYKNGSINTNGSLETQHLEDNNGDEEIDVKLEPPYET
ncbi:hypothetical protein LSTR_LSTR014606, partial [Laodelphax striatellus]